MSDQMNDQKMNNPDTSLWINLGALDFEYVNSLLEREQITEKQYVVYCYITTKASMRNNWISMDDLILVFGKYVWEDALKKLGQLELILSSFDEKKKTLYFISSFKTGD